MSFAVAGCDDGDDLERKTDASVGDTRMADTAPSDTGAGGTDGRDGAADTRDGATADTSGTSLDVGGDRPDGGTADSAPVPGDGGVETGGEGGTAVDAADTAGQ